MTNLGTYIGYKIGEFIGEGTLTRRQDQGAPGLRLTNWRRMLEKDWNSLSFGDLQRETRDGQHHFRLEVIFGGVDPQAVQVELFAAGPGDHARQPMARGDALPDREAITCLPHR